MTILILGLVLFLGTHSIRIFADDWRTAQRKRFGESLWKGGYALASIIGFGLIIWGLQMSRLEPVVIWSPPRILRLIAALLVLISFVLLVAAYIPRNGIKARLHHPMILGVKVWALAHLLVNGKLADLVLFGSFLAWSIFCFSAARKRDRATNAQYPAGTMVGTIAAVIVGVGAWVIFAFWLHGPLIGIPLFTRHAA